MGQSQSAQYNDMVKPNNPFEWRQIEDHNTFQIWQSISTGKRYAVYPIDVNQADSEQNIQIYHFRKLNYMHLVTTEAILKSNNDSFCGDSKPLRLLIENIPVRLSQINKKIGFYERLSILSTTFAALHTINYLYGPLYVTENMIGFAQNGKPKVWINENFYKNQPSRSAKGEFTQNSAIDELQLLENEMLVAQEMLNCVTQVFKTAGNSDVETYPIDFRVQAANVRTFAEGEQLIQNYCRNKGIELKETIPYWEYLKDTDSQCSGSHNHTFISVIHNENLLSNQNLNLQSLGLKQLPTQRPKRESIYGNLDQSTTRLNGPPRVLFTSGCNPSNTRIVINYGGQTLRKSNNQQVITSMTAGPFLVPSSKVISVPSPPINQTIYTHIPELFFRHQNKQKIKPQQTVKQAVQPVVSEELIEEHIEEPLPKPPQILLIQQENRHHFQVAQSLEELSAQHNQKILKASQQHFQEVKNVKKSSEEKLIIPRMPTQQYMTESQAQNSSNFTGFNTVDEIKMWQASLLMKISSKQAAEQLKVPTVIQYEPEAYSSCQSQEDSDQVRFGGEETGSIQNLKDMEAYIRNKYRDYLTNSNQNVADSQSDSNGGNDKFYSFGLKPGKLLRGRENSLSNLKPNVFKRRPSISDNVPVFDSKAIPHRDNSAGFMSKAKKLGIDSESKIIYEQSARQSVRESESELRYTTFGKIENKPQLSPFNKKTIQHIPEESSHTNSKGQYTASYGKLQDRYNKYVMNKPNKSNRNNNTKNISLNLSQTRNVQQNLKKTTQRPYFIDPVNESRNSQQSSYRSDNKFVNQIATPKRSTKRSQESIYGALTYDNLRDLLRK